METGGATNTRNDTARNNRLRMPSPWREGIEGDIKRQLMRGGCSFGGEPRLVVMMEALVIDSSLS